MKTFIATFAAIMLAAFIINGINEHDKMDREVAVQKSELHDTLLRSFTLIPMLDRDNPNRAALIKGLEDNKELLTPEERVRLAYLKSR